MPSLYHGGYLGILEDVMNRFIKKQADRIPIVANCSKLSIRLDAAEESPLIKSWEYGLSTCLLYQLLSSGVGLRNDRGCDLQSTLLDHIKRHQFDFEPPGPKHQLFFTQHCRFIDPEITFNGLKTRGWLYRLAGYRIYLTEKQYEKIYRERENYFEQETSLTSLDTCILRMLVKRQMTTTRKRAFMGTHLD